MLKQVKLGKWLFLICVVVGLALPVMAGETDGHSGGAPLDLTQKMMFLALQIGFILFAAKLGGTVATLLKLPSVLGELGAGVLIGPYALGGIGIGGGIFAGGMFPLPTVSAAGASTFPVTTELYGICTIASVILLFLSGIETDFKMFLRYSIVGTLVGIGGVVASFLFGDLCAVYLLPKFLPHYAGITMFSPSALFMGIMGTATSVGITARILSERKAMDTEEGVTIMAGAVIDDVLGIIVLAIGMGVIESSGKGSSGAVNWGSIGRVAAQAFGIWLGGTIIGVLAARKISWLLKLFRSPVAVATLAFGLSLVVAGIFQAMGLTLIIGAYVMGLALSRTDIRYVIQENLQSVYTFLVPIFFCVMGMMVDCSQLASRPVLIFGGIYTILAVLAKVIGCSIPSLFCGFNLLGSLRIGAGMIPRGEVALIIAGIGLSNGYLSPEVFGIGILMTLITTVVAPPCLVGLFSVKKSGVRHPRPNLTGSRPFSFAMQTDAAAALMLDNLIKAFRAEGFFTYLLNPQENIWEISKDATEIAISRHGNEIHFECTPAEEGFIATAIIEVSSSLNALAHDLSRPLKTGQLASILKDEETTPAGAQSFEVMHYARRFVMIPRLSASSVSDVIHKMVKAIADHGYVKDVAAVCAAVEKREAAMPTGLDHGLAVPHGRTDAVNGLVGAIALIDNENGVPGYSTIDNSPVRIVILTVASQTGTTPYLQLMSYLSRRLRAPEARAALRACKTPLEMMRFMLETR